MKEKRQIGFGDIRPPKSLKKYINEIIKTRRFTYGPITKKLEEEFGKIVGTKFNVYCSSGTAALFTALGVLTNLNEKKARERPYVILPACNFISDYNVILYNGFIPIFIDVNTNYNLNYTELESKLRQYKDKVFAVIGVSLMGRPVDGLRIRQILEDNTNNETFFILDSCENLASKYDGQFPESFADFTCFSTYLSHILVGGAVGGFISTSNEKLAIWSRSFINHGRDAGYLNIDADNNLDAATLKDITAKRFSFVQRGMNFRVDEFNSAIALSTLEDNFELNLETRRENFNYLVSELSSLPLKLPKFNDKEQATPMMLPIISNESAKLVEHLELNGVETRQILPMFQPITEQYFGNFLKFKTEFPIAAMIYEKGLYVGCHNYLTQEDMDYMVDVFEEYFK